MFDKIRETFGKTKERVTNQPGWHYAKARVWIAKKAMPSIKTVGLIVGAALLERYLPSRPVVYYVVEKPVVWRKVEFWTKD